MHSFRSTLALLNLFVLLGRAQEGIISGPTTDPSKFPYSCDPDQCKLPKCNCASTNPPGGLSSSDTPMFLVFTADDAIQTYTIDSVNNILADRKNPNGCPVKMTYYVSLNFTDFSLVTDWYVAGNEIADHTMTHVGKPGSAEINGNLIALNSLAGIPLSSIKGFRAPFLDYSSETLHLLAEAGFTYDSSATSSIPVTDPNTDAYWPYTLDYGLANDCFNQGLCNGEPKLPGFWEFPMYATFDKGGVSGPHLMDPWLDNANGESKANDSATLEYLKSTFTDHYNGKRQPFGLYTHPIHIAAGVPGLETPTSTINMIMEFIDWAQEQPNVWIVSNEQLLAWMQDPRPISQLDQVESFKCPTPQVSEKICNGMPDNEEGLLQTCAFPDFPWKTCYGCPVEQVSPANPSPPQATQDGQQARFRLPGNCSTPFWDPMKGICLCQSDDCQFTDNSRAIGPNGANLTSGESAGDVANNVAPSPTWAPFENGACSALETPLWRSLLLVCLLTTIFGL